jgi:hypothetical protein
MSCHASFPWSQDELAASASSSDNISSCRLPSQAETEALNPHHRRWPPSLDSPTPILHGQPDSHPHCYKKVISIFVTLPITQSRLYFASSLARASCHRSFTHRHCFLSPSFHVHHPSAQQHLRWWTSQPSFAFWISYQHVNSYKKIFWNPAASRGFIN